MAIMRLKQWAFDRTQLRAGRTARMEFSGWRECRMREADSRHVRVMDFERALSHLDRRPPQIGRHPSGLLQENRYRGTGGLRMEVWRKSSLRG
jgi:hypothetical protein